MLKRLVNVEAKYFFLNYSCLFLVNSEIICILLPFLYGNIQLSCETLWQIVDITDNFRDYKYYDWLHLLEIFQDTSFLFVLGQYVCLEITLLLHFTTMLEGERSHWECRNFRHHIVA